jgi:membrane-associated phospholipid phosphatase
MNDLDSHARPVARSRGNSTTRRQFLSRIRGGAGAALASSAASFGSSAEAHQESFGGTLGTGADRVLDSYQVRVDAARAEASIPVPKQMTNGDEQNYRNFIGNYHKGLPHNDIGEVIPNAYGDLLNALGEGTAAALEKKVTLGGGTKLVNCLAGRAVDLEGTDSHQLKIPPFPKLASQDLADQAVELYWMALCRDANFKYETDSTAQDAAKELSSLKEFKGPKYQGSVTAQTLFRGFTAGDVIGPYVSQFLLKPFNYGPYAMNGLMTVPVAGDDYLTTEVNWLASQNGQSPVAANPSDKTARLMRNGRDLANYVHTDPNGGLFMSFYNAGIFLFEQHALLQKQNKPSLLNPGHPYLQYTKQDPFGTFGVPFFLGLIGEAAVRAFKAAWYAKWFVHRVLRPDQYGGLVHWTKKQQKTYPLNTDILTSEAVKRVFAANKGSYFLPQAYPEAGPQHPSYPSGHATMAGACATILKAAFDGGAAFARLADNTVVVASDDGLSSVSVADPGLTIGGEIDKLASNIAFGRNFAGIHWRSDAEEGIRLGEAVALSILRDQSNNYAGEDFDGFTITKFDGTTVTV